jgi:hypothetical protein
LSVKPLYCGRADDRASDQRNSHFVIRFHDAFPNLLTDSFSAVCGPPSD